MPFAAPPTAASLLRSAVISTDEAFRARVREVALPERGVAPPLEIHVPFNELGDGHLKALRDASPEVIFLDVGQHPATGINLAQFLAEQNPHARLVAAGPSLSAEVLMAAMRAGISEYLVKPVAGEEVAHAIDATLRRTRGTEAEAQQQPGQIFAFFGPKGGSGSTTLATNLAIHLHRLTGKRTLLADLDLELGEVALQLGVDPRFNFADMVRNFHRMDAELLASFIERHNSGVHLLSAPYHPEKAEVVTGDRISKILQFLKQHYQYVVVDTSNSFSPATLATFEQADRIFLVTQADLQSLRNIKRCLPLLERTIGAVEERVHLVLNRHRTSDPIKPEDIEKTLGMKVQWTIANDYEAVVRSVNTGTPIVLNGESRYAQDVRSMSASIAGLAGGGQAPGGRLLRAFTDPFLRVFRRPRQPEVAV